MLTQEEHLDNLIRHITLVRDACLLLGKRLMKKGRREFGRNLIAKGVIHDASKFYGIEWKYLHCGKDVPKEELQFAIDQHRLSNDHHPEYWGGIDNMPELAVAEMLCDWYARAQEFGTGLRDWIDEEAVSKYGIDKEGEIWVWLTYFINILLEDSFSREDDQETTPDDDDLKEEELKNKIKKELMEELKEEFKNGSGNH